MGAVSRSRTPHHHRVGLDFSVEAVTQAISCHIQVIVRLQAEPELCRGSEEARQALRGVGTHAPLAEHDRVDAARRYVNSNRQAVLGQPHRFEKFFR